MITYQSVFFLKAFLYRYDIFYLSCLVKSTKKTFRFNKLIFLFEFAHVTKFFFFFFFQTDTDAQNLFWPKPYKTIIKEIECKKKGKEALNNAKVFLVKMLPDFQLKSNVVTNFHYEV